jgi:hypothetical protein
VRATVPVSRREFDDLVVQIQQTIVAVERLQQDYLIQVRRSGELQGIVNRLVQHVQAIHGDFGETGWDRVARPGRALDYAVQ